MALVFQYGSNTSPAEMNGQNRLRGDASPLGLVCTKDRYEFAFDVWSEGRKCFASDIRKSAKGRTIWGVLYKVPDDLMSRATVPHGRRSMDAIEGEGSNYRRAKLVVRWRNGKPVRPSVITYVVIEPVKPGATSREYATLILTGLRQHKAPKSYIAYVKRRIVFSNSELKDAIAAL
jgi:hypothetical protein